MRDLTVAIEVLQVKKKELVNRQVQTDIIAGYVLDIDDAIAALTKEIQAREYMEGFNKRLESLKQYTPYGKVFYTMSRAETNYLLTHE